MQSIPVSDQFVLTPLELCDADELFTMTNRNRGYLRQWLPWLDNIIRIEDTRAFIRSAQARLNRVEIRCAQKNHKSRAIHERLAFHEEGWLRAAEWLYDHFVDHVVYAALANDWPTVER